VGILDLASAPVRFRGMVGTGGIGYGSFFLLDGNEPLGREESRSGRLLDRRDYCKLHIISHYVKALMGDDFAVFPIGKVGDYEAGARLLKEMETAGLGLRYVQRAAGSPTLYSFCFLYPDGSGGNMTTGDSASGLVDSESIQAARDVMADLGSRGIALAAPEVPVAARRALLDLAVQHGLFRAASFTSAELKELRGSDILDRIDLLAVNIEEALVAAGIAPERQIAASQAEIASDAVAGISRLHPRLLLSITAGPAGSWAWDGQALSHAPALPVKPEGTAGAGDAHLAGLLSGLAAGLDLAEALQLGSLVASASVTSPHAINREITREMLLCLSRSRRGTPAGVSALLGD
jgi:ribokinase